MYDWLANEIGACRTAKFFATDGPMDERTRAAMDGAPKPVSHSYRAFAARFGNANFFRESVDGYRVRVFAAPRRLGGDLERFVLVARAGSVFAYFDTEGPSEDGESPIHLWVGGPAGYPPYSTGDTFEAWLTAKWRAARRRYGVRAWASIMAGPRPFSPEEAAIAEARERYEVRIVGVSDEGHVVFNVLNCSAMTLGLIEVGVRDREGWVSGSVRLDVSGIGPGTSGTVSVDCYRSLAPPERMEIVPMPPLGPEDRPFRWELRDLP
ncbi:MAG: hypothetical protein K2Q20_10265 [Phycisphaerales bacterium]|nr:hypothetical protein [Phycisphaerales bacterium]